MPTRLFPTTDPDVLYLVDLSSYVLRAYHAISELHSPSGEPTQAVHGTVSMLERLVRERQPNYLAIAMDSGRQTFRREMFPAYKSNRPPAPQDLKQQMARCEQIVEAFNIPTFKLDGVEADDLIACAVDKARDLGLKVIIVAADKDLMQLVDDDVLMWDTMRDRVFGPDEVRERFGVPIDRLANLFALIGDTSDNIPGVPSVGPKTACELITEYLDLEGIYEHVESLKKKALKAKLIEHRDAAFLSRTLVTLKRDCPIELELDTLRYGGRDTARLRNIYTELGFSRQLAALDEESASSGTGTVLTSAPQAVAEAEPKTILDEATLQQFVAEAEEAGKFSIMTYRATLERNAPVAGISLCASEKHSYYLPLAHHDDDAPDQLSPQQIEPALQKLSAGCRIIGHDLKRTVFDLQKLGIRCEKPGFDTLLASYLYDPEARHGLAEVVQRELGIVMLRYEELFPKKTKAASRDFAQLSVEKALKFTATQADMVLKLAERMEPKLEAEGLSRVFNEVELPLAEMLAALERTGVLIDADRLGEIGARFEHEIARLEAEAHRIAGREFNVHSPRQLETLLFDELCLKPIKRTKTARSTDAATLEALAEKHQLPKVILDIRQFSKLKSTYVDALPNLVQPDTGRIHSSWEQAVAATGRLSSTEPNLQNIPIRTELGRSIREAFVAPPGSAIISADYSQIELRVLAHLSQDPVLLDAFRTGQDIHTRTAMELFEVDEADITREMRTKSKAVNFGVIYGQGDSGLAKVLGIPRAEASNFIAAYFRRYEGVREFMNATLERARTGEAVTSLLGRRRILPDIRSANRAKRFAAERIAMNMPIQGTAADLLKLAMLSFRAPPAPGVRMVMTVHDELVFESPLGIVEEAKATIKERMEAVYPLDVPLLVEIGHGSNWNLAH